MINISIMVVLAAILASVGAIAWLFWPKRRRKAGPEDNCEQRLNEDFPSAEVGVEDTFNNVEKGFGIALGHGER